MTSYIELAVEEAAEELDETYGPKWPKDVRTQSLDICNPFCCVLGQLYPNWPLGDEEHDRLQKEHPFAFGYEGVTAEAVEELQQEWLRLIRVRRGMALPAGSPPQYCRGDKGGADCVSGRDRVLRPRGCCICSVAAKGMAFSPRWRGQGLLHSSLPPPKDRPTKLGKGGGDNRVAAEGEGDGMKIGTLLRLQNKVRKVHDSLTETSLQPRPRKKQIEEALRYLAEVERLVPQVKEMLEKAYCDAHLEELRKAIQEYERGS